MSENISMEYWLNVEQLIGHQDLQQITFFGGSKQAANTEYIKHRVLFEYN